MGLLDGKVAVITGAGSGMSGPKGRPDIVEKSATGRGGQSADMAEVAAFRASDGASYYVTGAIVPVDGGWSVWVR